MLRQFRKRWGYSTMKISDLVELKQICEGQYGQEQRRMRLLDATDNGDLWKAIAASFPSYQILPDTNFVAYVKANLLASIYTVGKSAQIQPTSKDDVEIVQQLNVWLDNFWDTAHVGYFQFQAGERAALLNKGVTQIGWCETADRAASRPGQSKTVILKNIDPIKFMRDPFALDLDTAGYCMYHDDFHKSVFMADDRYSKGFETFKKKTSDMMSSVASYDHEKKGSTKDYYTLGVFWVWEDGKLNEYHTLNDEVILYTKEDLKPSMFPFAELYCNLPGKRLIGTSEPAKIFANNTAINLLDSIALTAEYKNQRPPKFISSASGLNIAAFKKFGNEADHTFIVNGPAERAVHYHEYPTVGPMVASMKQGLQQGIQTISGVDGRYTGRDTGSILTTGGIEDMLDRATLIDTPKIMMYEMYTRRLTELILRNFVEHSPDREYFVKDPKTRKWDTMSVPFMKIDANKLFKYSVSISSELPKNKARLAAFANAMMEKQMQYGQANQNGPQLMTEEEWLMLQDLPNREYMLERMGVERLNNTVEDVAQTLFTYANLVKDGANPDDAILATANAMDKKRQGQEPPPPEVPPLVQQGALPSDQGQSAPMF